MLYYNIGSCRLAVNMNLLAVRKMVNLCKGFKKLEVFVHVSTAYANCERPYIEEMIYPPPVEPQKLIDAMEYVFFVLFYIFFAIILLI